MQSIVLKMKSTTRTALVIKRNLYTLTLLLLVMVISLPGHSFEQWPKTVNDDIIAVNATRTDNGVIKVSAKMMIKSTPQAFFALLENAQDDCSWLSRCKSVSILNDDIPHLRFVHTSLNSPWPIRDREMFTVSEHQFDPLTGDLSIMISDISSDYPPTPNTHLVQVEQAQWSMTKQHQDWYELQYYAAVTSSGWLPKWLNQHAVKDATLSTFTSIRSRLHDK